MEMGVEYIVLPSVALVINLALIGLLIRQRRVKWGGGFRETFVLLFAFNAAIIITQIGTETTASVDLISFYWKVGITAVMCVGGILAGIATRLYRPTPPEKTEWRAIIPTIKYPPCLALIVAFLSFAALAWMFTPFNVVRVSADFEPWYALCLSVAAMWVLAYCTLLLLTYSRRQDPVGKRYVRILTAGFVLMVIFYVIFGFVSPYLRAFYNIEYLVVILPLAAMAYVLRVPTVLERILPVVESRLPGEPKFKLEAGHNYMVKGELAKAYEVFLDQVGHGIPGLCVSKLEPEKVRERYGLRKTPIIWVTFREAEGAVGPRLVELRRTGAEMTKRLKTKKGVALMDCFDIIKTVNGFEGALGFLKEMKGMVAASEWSMLVAIDPTAFTAKQLGALELELEGVGA